jgi:hypothetical protein
MDLILTLPVAALCFGVLRRLQRVRSTPPGAERDELANGLWFVGGAATAGAAIIAGLPPLSLPLAARILGIGCGAALFVVGGVRQRRFITRLERQLLKRASSASEVVDRVEVLDRLKVLYRVPPLRVRLSLVTSQSMVIAVSAWGAWVSTGTQGKLLFSFIAASSAALLVLGFEKTRRLERKRADIDAEISHSLGSGMAADLTDDGE